MPPPLEVAFEFFAELVLWGDAVAFFGAFFVVVVL
jgi:hypothetical protein